MKEVEDLESSGYTVVKRAFLGSDIIFAVKPSTDVKTYPYLRRYLSMTGTTEALGLLRAMSQKLYNN